MQLYSNYNDTQLWQEIQAGNIACFDVLYHRHIAALTSQAYKITGDLTITQDILQDVFTKLYLNKNNIAAGTNVGAYLNTAVKHQSLNLLRDQLTRKKHQEAVALQREAAENNQPAGYDHVELKNKVSHSIHSLPGKCREAFTLRYYDNLSYKAIADHLHLSVKTVEKHISKAMHILRQELKDEHYFLIIVSLLLQ